MAEPGPSNLRPSSNSRLRSNSQTRPSSTSHRTPISTRPASVASVRPLSSTSSTRPPSRSTGTGGRPASVAAMRPSSSAASVRPSSSASYVRSASSAASIRPSSSAASVRPSTSASTRPVSRIGTTRSTTRLTNRPTTRQSSRLVPLFHTLASQILDIPPNDSEADGGNTNPILTTAVEYISKNLDPTIRPAVSTDITSVDKQIRGHVQKARIKNEDELADALKEAYARLKKHVEGQGEDLDAEIHKSRLPSHLQFLLALSEPPSQSTLQYASNYMELVRNPPPPPKGLTWQDILAEEPFEGQHWQGAYGLPPGSTVEDWEEESSSTDSLSLLDDYEDDSRFDTSDDDDDDARRSERPAPSSPPSSVRKEMEEREQEEREKERKAREMYAAQEVYERLVASQYWRPGWQIGVPLDRPFDFGDPSTLGPAFRRALAKQSGVTRDELVQEKYIREWDAVREILMGLQGRSNIMLQWTNAGEDPFKFVPAPDHPGLLHLTSSSLRSVLTSFSAVATTVEHLRRFVSAIFSKTTRIRPQGEPATHVTNRTSYYHRSTRTLEALSDSIDAQVRAFDSWCANREEAMVKAQHGIGPQLVVSILSLEVALRDEFASTFTAIVNILRQVVQKATRSPEPITEIWTLPDLPQRMTPSGLTAFLLDSLLLSIQEYSTLGDNVTSQSLMRVFSDTAEPTWTAIHRWLKDGMPIREVMAPEDQYGRVVDEEFFIEDNELVLLDPDFWQDGYVLRTGSEEEGTSTAVPIFLDHVAEYVLSAGKAVGLLRALGMFSAVGEGWLSRWPNFSDMLQPNPKGKEMENVMMERRTSSVVSTDDFSRVVYDKLIDECKRAQETLTKVLVEDCELYRHLVAAEDLYLMRRGDSMSHYLDVLFVRMDSTQPWTDFHFLNSAFRDVVEAGRTPWIDPSLVRFSHRSASSKDKSKVITRTVRAIEGLSVEYAIPFPLTYIFNPRTMQVYSSIFAFVLMIRRAQRVLQRILVRSALDGMLGAGMKSELKAFYAVRGKLSWFVNVLLNFICTNVLHAQVLVFHAALKKAKSLDEMVSLHEDHVRKLEGRCLLQRNTSALHRAVISVLDMTIHFADCFVAFAGDTTHDISRQSLVLMKKHRSRRQKRQRKNVIGFSQSLKEMPDSSDSSDDDADEEEMSMDGAAPEPSFSLTASASFVDGEESFYVRLDKMSGELDTLVRFIRRGVESLAGGSSEAAPAFEVFAFALEDWDR
ncbi:hypothetical protein K474DRAFT_1704411 [Panus rudis PR-1116 ss-1]|nr:hypothetical protein K474DRAFT_1704411 [Panus rudis PR-1116 ss-1]